jgi:DNA repair protein RecO (recombination protein O)
MPEIKATHALILAARPWSESSRIVDALSPDLGRFSAAVRGAEKHKDGLAAAVEPITLSALIIRQSARGGLAQVTGAETLENFPHTKRSLVPVAVAGALCELAVVAMPEDESNPMLFDHLCGVFRVMEKRLCRDDSSQRMAGPNDRDVVNLLWHGVLLLARDLGYGMQFDNCVSCGADGSPTRGFCLSEGGPVCFGCVMPNTLAWDLSVEETLRWIGHVDGEESLTRRLTREQNRQIRSVFEQYFRFHIPGFERFKSLDLLIAVTKTA